MLLDPLPSGNGLSGGFPVSLSVRVCWGLKRPVLIGSVIMLNEQIENANLNIGEGLQVVLSLRKYQRAVIGSKRPGIGMNIRERHVSATAFWPAAVDLLYLMFEH